MENFTDLQSLRTAAINAHRGTSFSPEQRGEQMISSYQALINADMMVIHDATDEQKQRYAAKFKQLLSAYMGSMSRIVSTMIAGPSNFPVRRMEKLNRFSDNAYSNFNNWREAALKGIKKSIEKNMPEEMKWLKQFQILERNIRSSAKTIMEIDNGINTYSTRALFVKSITGSILTCAKHGHVELVENALDLLKELNSKHTKPIVTENHKVFNALEDAKAVRSSRVEAVKKENTTYQFDGGEIILNFEADRIQVQHDNKPAPEIISLLKKNAFKWSPSNKVWQRQITANAIHATNNLFDVQIPLR